MKAQNINGRGLRLIVVGLLLLGISLACTSTGGEGEEEGNIDDVIGTSVAETMAAQSPGVTPSPSDTPNAPPTAAIPPTATISPTSEPDIMYQGISFSYDDSLASSIAPEIIPAEEAEIGPFANLPEYIQSWIQVVSATG